jgi:hypothetical protein
MRIITTILFIIATFTVNATNYYISNLGNNSNDGLSPETSKQTLSSITNASPGDTIFYKRGDVWRENFVFYSSGTSGNQIVFDAYGTGDNPRFTGANLISSFSDGGSNIWDATVTTEPLVVLKSRTLQTNAGSRAAIDEEGEWFWTGNTLSVYATSDPSGLVEAANRSDVLSTAGRNYLTFRNITVECSNTRDYAMVHTSYSSTENSVKFYNCIFQYSAGYGIWIGAGANGAVSNGMLDSCIIRYNWNNGIFVQYSATSYTIRNCEIYSNGLDPVNAANGIWGNLGGFTISNCDVYDNGIGVTNGPPHGIYHHISAGTVTIRNCTIHDQPNGSGIRLRGDAIVSNNAIYDNADAGINIDQNESAGETYTITGNLIYGNDDNAVIVGGASSGSLNLVMYNNTIYHDGAWGIIELAYTLNSLTLKNNIFYVPSGASAYYLINAQYVPTTRIIDYNIYYRGSGGTDLWRMGESYPSTLSAWQALEYDANGSITDPLLTSSTDYTLQSESPAIDAGTDVGLTRDFLGYVIDENPDIGAYEYGALPPPTVSVVYKNSNGKLYKLPNGKFLGK